MNKPFSEARDLVVHAIEDVNWPKFGRRSSTSFSPLGWFIAGAALGTVAMYLLDPDKGRERRTQIRDQGNAWKNDVTRLAEEKTRSWRASAQNLLATISGSLPNWKEEEAIPPAGAKVEDASYLH